MVKDAFAPKIHLQERGGLPGVRGKDARFYFLCITEVQHTAGKTNHGWEDLQTIVCMPQPILMHISAFHCGHTILQISKTLFNIHGVFYLKHICFCRASNTSHIWGEALQPQTLLYCTYKIPIPQSFCQVLKIFEKGIYFSGKVGKKS